MYCIHLCPNPPAMPLCREAYQWLDVGGGLALCIHADCHKCEQPATRMPHIMLDGAIPAALAAALTAHGVTTTDTMLQAMMKVAPTWSPAWP